MFDSIPAGHRICKLKDGCIKPESEFFSRKAKNGKYYLSPYCKEHEREKARVYKKLRYSDSIVGPTIKSMNKKRTSDPEYRIIINQRLRDKYSTDAEYRQQILDTRREDREDPIIHNKIRDRASKYYQKHKQEIITKSNKKRAENPRTRLRGYMRGRISEALACVGKSKNCVASLAYLPYKWDELYAHLESQFEEWMNFQNYGQPSGQPSNDRKWQVDHIIPQAYFPYDSMDSDLFRWCWDLTNLRPLDAKRNFTDGDRHDLLGPVRDIRIVFQELRDQGTTIVSNEMPAVIYGKLQNLPLLDNTCSMSMAGLSYLDSIFDARFLARTANFSTILESLNDDQTLIKVIQYLIQRGERVTRHSVLANLRWLSRTPGNFFPAAAYSIINKYANNGSVFDPFIGWGGRLVGALCSSISSYTGCDLQHEVIDSCKTTITDFRSVSSVLAEVHEDDCLSYLKRTNSMFDLIFTSPPYMDTENYNIESDAMRGDWLDLFIIPICHQFKFHLKSGGVVALHLKDLKGAPTYTAYHASMRAAGFKLIARHKYGRTWTQGIYVYQLESH